MIATALQTAFFKRLSSDAALKKLVKGVYDYLPAEARSQAGGQATASVYPYITLGEDSHAPMDMDDANGHQSEITLHVWSKYRGTQEAKKIQAHIYALLHRQPLPVEGYSTTSPTLILQDIIKDPDGETLHGVQRFEIYARSQQKIKDSQTSMPEPLGPLLDDDPFPPIP